MCFLIVKERNSMLKIGICDDEQVQIDNITKLLSGWAKGVDKHINIKTFTSAESFLFHYETDKAFDLLFLDIEMGEISGMELAKRIRKENESLQIVFITGFTDYISEGYDVSALHYLMKPVAEEKLFEVLNKAVSKVKTKENCIFVDIENVHTRILTGDILYAESFSHSSVIVTTEKEYVTRLSFSAFEKLLDDSFTREFIRCHRSYIVGIKHIKSITKTDVILDNGKAIPLSRRLYHEANQAFIKYFKGEL